MSGSGINSLLAQRFSGAIKKRGKSISLRMVSRLNQTDSMPNPPTISNPVINGASNITSTSINIKTTDCNGRLVAGDFIIINSISYKIALDVPSIIPNNDESDITTFVPGFNNVTITTGLLTNVPDGTPVSFVYAADFPTFAVIKSYPRNFVDGTLIQLMDLECTIPAYRTPQPQLQWLIVIPGTGYYSYPRRIISISPLFASSEIVAWQIQAR